MPIEMQINTRNIDLDDSLRDYVTKKVDKLDRFLDILDHATVDLNYIETARSANDRHVAQITVRGKGALLRAEERTADMRASVDAVTEKILRQIDRYKGKRWNPRGDGRSVAEAMMAERVEESADERAALISRRKKFLLAPMDEQEALEQMSLLGHEMFFVYLDANSGSVNVLYKRRDGTYGLIETDVG